MQTKFGLLLICALFLQTHFSSKAFALALNSVGEDAGSIEEDESADSTSRFGLDPQAKRHAAISLPLRPIDETSFESPASLGGGRGPASVGDRGPATVSKVKLGAVKSVRKKKNSSGRAYQEIAVIANDLGFFPSTLFLTQGVPVRLFVTGASAKSQCLMLDEFGVRRQIRNQKIEEITFTPDQSGSFAFSCPMNGAKGRVIVKELEASVRVPASVAADPIAVSAPKNDVRADAPRAKSEISDSDFTSEFRKE